MAMAVIALALLSAVPAEASTFLGAHQKSEMQSIPTQELEQLLLSELASFDTDARLSSAVAELRPLHATLPKNERGNLDPTVVRYALHRYFAKKYGWHLRGLEPGGGAWNASAPANIMKDRAPSYIMDVFEQRLNGQGLGLKELAVFAVTLSELVRKEAVSDLEDIFTAVGVSRSAPLTAVALSDMLRMYFMTYITGVHAARNNSDDFVHMEREMESVIVWLDAKAWMEDLTLSFHHTQLSRRNPFVNDFKFETVADIALEIGHHFGSFQNTECKASKDKLVDMEHGGSGRVALSKFWSGINDDQDWPFIESVDYLRNLGALDESDPRMPSVIIANFLGGPSNCETPSNLYRVCCIDECEGLLTQVELAVAEPTGTVSRLVEIISHLQSDTVAAPRNLSSVQIARLGEIAEHHGGRVPLHGRLFAQWMHHAYPRECRFPHEAGSTNPLTQHEYMSKSGLEAEVSDEEIAKYQGVSLETSEVSLPWTKAEELIAAHRPHQEARHSNYSAVRVLVLIAAVLSVGVPAIGARKHLGLDTKEKYLV